MYIKIASIIEILLGFAIGGFGGFIFWLSFRIPGPTAIMGPLLGAPMILVGILLIIFGVNLLKLKKWAWVASIVILIIAIASSVFLIIGFRDSLRPILISLCAAVIICLILLILGIRKIFPARKKIESLPQIQIKKRTSIPWKKFLKPNFAKIFITVIFTLPLALGFFLGGASEFYLGNYTIIAVPSIFTAYPIFSLIGKIGSIDSSFLENRILIILLLLVYYYILACLAVFVYKKISSKIGGGQKIRTFFIPNKEKIILFIVLSILIGCWYWTNLNNPLHPFTVDILKGLLTLPLSYLISCIIFGIWGRDRRKTLLVVLTVVALITVGAIGYYFKIY